MKKILITGAAGFIGSNFVEYYLKKNQNDQIIVLDALTYAGSKNNIQEFIDEQKIEFIQGDIREANFLEKLFQHYRFSDIIHFAAESHVDNSISDPAIFIETNVLGTFNLLNKAYLCWMDAPFQKKPEFKNSRFHHISTDEVYGSLGPEGFFTETTPYAPNSPYSASKASSDMIVRSYFHTFGLNVVTSNCSNNYGPKQHKEKLIPTIIRKALTHETIPIYGNGDNVRDWLYVTDHCSALESIFHGGKPGEIYNVGGDSEKQNLDVAKQICLILDKKRPWEKPYESLIGFVKDRPGHDWRYAIDATKIKKELGWQAQESFETGLEKTVDWYLQKGF